MVAKVTIPNTFATATTAIPLSQLDANFSNLNSAINSAITFSNYAPDTGTANNYIITITDQTTTYAAGVAFQFKAANANTGASTLNVNGQGAKSIVRTDGSALAAGDIVANGIVSVMYDGTNFQLMNDAGGAGETFSNITVTGNANASNVYVSSLTSGRVVYAGTSGRLIDSGNLTFNGTTLTSAGFSGPLNGSVGASTPSTGAFTTLSASSTVTFSGGTANGVLYLDGSKNAASGSSLTFDGTTLYSASNTLIGTTTNYSSTTNAGSLAIGGVGIYPYTTNSGTTNSTISSTLNLENLTTFAGNNGTSSQSYYGIVSSPKISNTGAGGTGTNTGFGIFSAPTVQSSGASARVFLTGGRFDAIRGNANDTSTSTNNVITGINAQAQHLSTAGAGIVSGSIAAGQFQASNQNGTITTAYGVLSTANTASATTALTASSTTAYQYYGTSTVGAASGGPGSVTNLYGFYNQLTVGATGTVTNYYGLYLNTPSVTGTLTNRWGVYQADTSATNFFGGNVGIGTTSPSTYGKFAVNVGNVLSFSSDEYSNALIATGTSANQNRGLNIQVGNPGSLSNSKGAGINLFGNTQDNPTTTGSAGSVAIYTSTDSAITSPNGNVIRFHTGSSSTERARIDSSGFTQFNSNLVMPYQGAPTSKSTTATLTGAELITGILNTTGTSYTVTLPTGTSIEGALAWSANNVCLDWWVINTASGTITIDANGNTTLGTLTIATGVSAHFRIRRTGANTFTVYRLS